MNEHENPNNNFEQAKHLRDLSNHKLDWKMLLTTPTNTKLGEILESLIITLKRPRLNEQLVFDQLILFRNGFNSLGIFRYFRCFII